MDEKGHMTEIGNVAEIPSIEEVDLNGEGYVKGIIPALAQKSQEIRVRNDKTGAEKGAKPESYDQLYWPFIAELAKVYHFGSQKYAPYNYAKGYDWSLSFAALQRHIVLFWNGESHDSESGLHHLAHAAWHLSALFLFERMHPELDDRYFARADND